MGSQVFRVIQQGHWNVGFEQDRGLGLGHHELRMVGRYRSRRYPHQRRVVAVPPEMAHGHQPFRRGDDHFRRDHGGYLPHDPHGPHLDGLLGVPPAQPVRFTLGELQQSAALGRIRDQHLLQRIARVLVHRIDPRPRTIRALHWPSMSMR